MLALSLVPTQQGRQRDVDPEYLGQRHPDQPDGLAAHQSQDDEDQQGEDRPARGRDGAENGPGGQEDGGGGEEEREGVRDLKIFSSRQIILTGCCLAQHQTDTHSNADKEKIVFVHSQEKLMSVLRQILRFVPISTHLSMGRAQGKD